MLTEHPKLKRPAGRFFVCVPSRNCFISTFVLKRVMDAKTSKSELTRTAIIGAALDLAAEQGLEAITLQAVADRVGLSKSGVFARVGSREALQSAVIEEYDRRFLADVFVPAMQVSKGLPRLNAMVRRWIERAQIVEANTGCIYVAGAFELDDRDGVLREQLLRGVLGWRAALRRVVVQAIEAGDLLEDADPDDLVAAIYGMMVGMIHDARFVRDPRAADHAHSAYERLIRSCSVPPRQRAA
jgi:AcrR family transcriptional regulator